MPKEKDRHQYAGTNIRFSEEEKADLDRLAVYLHKQGVFGMTDQEGKAVKVAVIRYLLKQAIERIDQEEKS